MTTSDPSISSPARRLLHTREVLCQGYERDDGLWDIEARMSDVKTHPMHHDDGRVRLPVGRFMHRMGLCLTVDEGLRIVAARAWTEHAPNAECMDIGASYEALVGLSIGPGFTSRVKERFGGAAGCTHLTELLGPVATTAFQTLFPVFEQRRRARLRSDPEGAARTRPPLLDSCFALRAEGEVARGRWPAFAKPA
ncbi:DUF2889 domain-containing protein [Variovorax sp.]|uniref:DUF2889 domain-containing protein n=1 Tax=Variovorax sp. TaxID=1871043 RepID=UPI00137D4DAD|nr:DUF2889 domain-containing protein [Variovorax sp.]KAF1061184.1 MAG: hypothetical protein GAK39_05874 [Variovorax sp.]